MEKGAVYRVGGLPTTTETGAQARCTRAPEATELALGRAMALSVGSSMCLAEKSELFQLRWLRFDNRDVLSRKASRNPRGFATQRVADLAGAPRLRLLRSLTDKRRRLHRWRGPGLPDGHLGINS